MQRDILFQQLKEEVEKAERFITLLQSKDELSLAEAEQWLSASEKLTKYLVVYTYLLKNETSLHVKLMQVAQEEEKAEPAPLASTEALPPEVVKEEKAEPAALTYERIPEHTKKVELSLNDRFRIINELFAQNQQEFQAALQQLNATHTKEETLLYLNSLKEIYKWKDENALVKTLYLTAQKRFA
ncbi:MAG: hypothetical protein JST67_06910 [Bacteroidetes bacterium]|nr:hypothetical protein [Bacteroidota bacterium]